MPTYDYRCAKCGEDLEVYQSFSETPLTRHKGCGGKLAKVLSPAGIVLKGSGFYKTDNRASNGKHSGEKKDSGSNGHSAAKSSELSSPDSGGSPSDGQVVGPPVRHEEARGQERLSAVSPAADVGVFGGSGFYSFLDAAEEVEIATPFGAPSDPVTIGTVGESRVAFIPRHGRDHRHMPSAVPARANLWALRSLGVRVVIGPCAAGSLKPTVHPGDFVVLDQLVDRTWGRADTFYDAGLRHHVSFADPYCPVAAAAAVSAAQRTGVPVHEHGTVVVVQGPRFSTRAESAWRGLTSST
jgi:putative FmdB family regulatory protein